MYLIFNEGYDATRGEELLRVDLATEAIRLGRLLGELVPDDPEVAGLLALLLLHHARAAARVDRHGDLVPLEEQDRSRWDAVMLAEGLGLLDRALRRRRPGRYQLQAAIAAQHALAARAADTDWRQIAALYAELLRLRPSPTYELWPSRWLTARMPAWRCWTGWRRPAPWPATTCSQPPGPTWNGGPAAPPWRRPPTARPWSWPPTRSSAATSAAASTR